MSDPTVVYDDGDLQLTTWSRVFINRWTSGATRERLQTLSELQGELIAATDDRRIAVITVLADKRGLMPSAEARKEAEVVARTHSHAVMMQAQIIEGDGFVAATGRAMLSGINMAIRAPYPIKVFKSADQAVPWMQELLRKSGYRDDAAGLPGAVRAISSGWAPVG